MHLRLPMNLASTPFSPAACRNETTILSISPELVDAEHDRVMWSKQYRWRLADVPGAEKSRMAQRPTENGEAYQLYLRGRFYWNKRTADAVNKAMGYFQQGIDRDPTYALAYG